MSCNVTEMKPCENKLNHESILNRRKKNGQSCWQLSLHWTLSLVFFIFLSLSHIGKKKENDFHWDWRQRRSDHTKIPACSSMHIECAAFAFVFTVHVVLLSTAILLDEFPASFLLASHTDPIAKDNNKFNVPFFFSLLSTLARYCTLFRMCFFINDSLILYVLFVCRYRIA